MKTIKKYQRWPKDKEALQKKLKRICRIIDSTLEPKYPSSVLCTQEGKENYEKDFQEIFNQVDYVYHQKPEVMFGTSNRLCGGGITITFLVKDRDGILMHC